MVSDWQLISKTRAQGSQVRNMSIVEDLGMLHYVFADKTGTLTCNKMEFHSMCIGDEVFGPNIGQSQRSGMPIDFNFQKFEEYISGKK